MGRPRASWLRQIESYLKDMGMMATGSAWRSPDGGRKSTIAGWTRLRAASVSALTPDILLRCKVVRVSAEAIRCGNRCENLTRRKRPFIQSLIDIQSNSDSRFSL